MVRASRNCSTSAALVLTAAAIAMGAFTQEAELAGSRGGSSTFGRESASTTAAPTELIAGSAGDRSKAGRESA
jgi:hypothetical protein